MAARKDTTIGINKERKEKLQSAAVKITIATERTITTSAIVQYMIDNYINDAVKDLSVKK